MGEELHVERVMEAAITESASDIHFRVGRPPMLRLNGRLRPLRTATLDEAQMVRVSKSLAPERAQAEVQEKGSADFAYGFDFNGKQARFRANLFREQGRLGLVLRRLPNLLLKPEQIGLGPQVIALTERPRGLVLVTGPTGSGKTTTLAALVNHIATTSERHVITIEEPTEYRFDHGRGLVTQREVPTDVGTFEEGLRHALRQNPDVIMVGEMRDLAAARVAITAAETGHLVLSTLHTVSAAKTVDRLIEQFPEGEQAQVRTIVSTCLLAVLCQQLIARKDGAGRVAAFEFMVNTPGIGNLIRERKTEQMESQIKIGSRLGMQLLDDHLYQLVMGGSIDLSEAILKSNHPAELASRCRT